MSGAIDIQPVAPDLRTFGITLLDGTKVELRYTWPAMARIESWLGVGWTSWALLRHTDLAAAIAGGMLHEHPSMTPDLAAQRLDPRRLAEYRQLVDDAVTFAHTGKTRAERVREAEEAKRKEEEPGEAPAASP